MTSIEQKLIGLSWSTEMIRTQIAKAYHECMEAFYSGEDDEYTEQIKLIMQKNIGLIVRIEELFQAYDNVLEDSYPSEFYYAEREKADNYERY